MRKRALGAVEALFDLVVSESLKILQLFACRRIGRCDWHYRNIGILPVRQTDILSVVSTQRSGYLFSAKGAAFTASLGQRP